MLVKASVHMDVRPRDLAEALAKSPDDFAAFWFSFAEIVRDGKIDLEAHGKAMAPSFGGIRKHPFLAILDYMRYYERRAEAE